jgi:RNA recognition motif-containing protein
MYAEGLGSSGASKGQQQSTPEEIEVTIRNLPNEVTKDEILEYLSVAGSIKSSRFAKEEERYSATVVYHDPESAELCKKFMGDHYYKGRVLTITTEVKRSYPNGPPPNTTPTTFDDELARLISALKPD